MTIDEWSGRTVRDVAMSPRVGIEFGGENKGALAAAKGVTEAVTKVKASASEQAAANVKGSVEQRDSLEKLAVEYSKIAKSAESSGEQQAAAARLAKKATDELTTSHGGLSRSTQNATKDLEKFTKGAAVGTGVFGGLGRSVAIASGAFLGGEGLIQLFKESTSEAGDLEKQLERTSTTFGSSAAAVKAWSETSAKAMGLARSDALDAANTIATLLHNMDVAPAKAKDMSEAVVQLAADMASFKGVDPAVALSALESGLQGRTRSLKQFGIVIDATSIKEEAYRDGIAKTTVASQKLEDAQTKVEIATHNVDVAVTKHGKDSAEAASATVTLHSAQAALAKASAGSATALTNEQKALATYSLIMRQTTSQQGAFAKNSGDLAGQEQILKAQIKDLQEELGTALIPQLERLLPLITGWIDRNEKNGKLQADFNKAAKIAGDTAIAVEKSFGDLKHVLDLLGDTVGGDGKALEILAGIMVGAKIASGFATAINFAKGLKLALLESSAAAGEAGLMGSLTGLSEMIAANPILMALLVGAVAGPLALELNNLVKNETATEAPQGINLTSKSYQKQHPYGSLTYDPTSRQITSQHLDASGDLVKSTVSMAAAAKLLGEKVSDLKSAIAVAIYTDPQKGQKSSGGNTGSIPASTAAARSALAEASPAAKAIVGQAYAKGPSSGGIYGESGGGAGAKVGGTVYYDCSGYAQAVFEAAGFKGFPRSSETQFSTMRGTNWIAQAINPSEVQAGDLVFYNYNNGYKLPASHVAIVVSGTGLSAKTIEYTSSGKPAIYGTVGEGPLAGARRYSIVKQDGTGDTTPKVDDTTGDTTVTPDPFTEKTKTKSPTAAVSTTLANDVAKINQAVKTGALSPDVGAELQKRADAIRKTITGATKADLPAIRAQLSDFQKAIETGVHAAAASKTLAGDVAKINADVSKGILSPAVAKEITAQANKLSTAISDGLTDTSKIKKGTTAVAAALKEGLAQAADQKTIAGDVKTINADLQQGLISPDLAKALLAKAAAMNTALAKKLYDPADFKAGLGKNVTALKGQITSAAAQIADASALETDLGNMGKSLAASLQSALETPVAHASAVTLAAAEELAAKLNTELTTKILTAAERTAIENQITATEATIQDGLDGIVQAVDTAKTQFETSWSRFSDATLSAFDDETQSHLNVMQKAASVQLAALEKNMSTTLAKMQTDTAAAIKAMQVTVAGNGFASFLYGGSTTQTPTEALLAQMADAKEVASDAQSIADAQQGLADAQAALAAGVASPGTAGTGGVGGHPAVTLPGGISVTGIGSAGSDGTTTDLASLQAAVTAAQKSLDDAIYNQKVDALQKQADLERTAADTQLQAAQDAAQTLADQQQQAYQDAQAALELNFSDQEDVAEKAYSSQRDAARTALQYLLTDDEKALEDGSKSLAQVAGDVGDALGGGLYGGLQVWFDPSNPAGVYGLLTEFLAAAQAASAVVASLGGDGTGTAAAQALGVAQQAAAAAQGTAGAKAAADAAYRAAQAAGYTQSQGALARAGIVPFATGGTVPGSYVGRKDTVSAVLTQGEEIVDRSTAIALRSFLGRQGGQTSGGGQFAGASIYVLGTTDRQVAAALKRLVDGAPDTPSYGSTRG